ncbi:MAG: hypothetical protein HC802_09145 [Caldilineaceae bacterium]|nr:hypothetical protein [Caldilineaceae bacterium]
MNTKVNVDINLRNVQEQAEDAVKHVRTTGRRAFLISVGMAGMAYDAGVWLWEDGAKLLDKAEDRGEEIEQKFFDEINKLRDQTTDEAMKIKNRVAKDVGESSKTVEQEVEKILNRVGFGSKPSIADEPGEIQIERVEEAMAAPFEGYMELTAAEVIERVKLFDNLEALETLQAYEMAHKNRVTVLREVEQRLEELTSPEAA